MFKKETDISAFFNLRVCLEPGNLVGFIEGTFGTSGQSALCRNTATPKILCSGTLGTPGTHEHRKNPREPIVPELPSCVPARG
jgi:hypothetical protein